MNWSAALAAAVLVAAGALLAGGPSGQRRLRALSRSADRRGGQFSPRQLVTGLGTRTPLVVAVAGAVGLGLSALLASPVPAVSLPLAGWLLLRSRRAAAANHASSRTRTETRQFCSALADEVRSGSPAGLALRRAASEAGTLGAEVTAGLGPAAADHNEPIPVLRRLARQPGAEALARVAACWAVSQTSGGSLAPALRRLVAGLDADDSLRQETAAQLAGPRTTAGLLALLPAGGLFLGAGLGADPFDVLLHTPYGWACALGGGALDVAGLLWTRRIVRGAEERP